MLMSARTVSSPTKESLSPPLIPFDKSLTPTSSPRKPFFVTKTSKDENKNRKDKVIGFLDQFNAQIEVLKKNEKSMLDFKGRLKENSESLYRILESIFALYNVNIQIIFQDQSDSAMRIEPIIHPSKAVQTLLCIALVLSKFPYSLIKVIDLNKFTVCKAIYLKKEGYETLFNARVMSNAIFSTQDHNSYNKIERHFYKIVLYHVEKKMPSLHKDWPIERSFKLGPLYETKKSSFSHFSSLEKSNGSLMSIRSPSPTEKLDKQKGKTYNADEIKNKEKNEIFYKILKNPRELLDTNNFKVQNKAKFLKEILESVDPVGVDLDWWDELIKGNLTVPEDVMDNFF